MTISLVKDQSRRWYGVYQARLDCWVPEASLHPGKMQFGLCHRLLDHLEDLGLLRPGMTILDPMAGVGTTAMCAVSRGYRAVTIDLEQLFVDMQAGCECTGTPLDGCGGVPGDPTYYRHGHHVCPACQRGLADALAHKSDFYSGKHFYEGNLQLVQKVLCKSVSWDILQGDALTTHQLLTLKDLVGPTVVVMSPPYLDALSNHIPESTLDAFGKVKSSHNIGSTYVGGLHYSNNPNNIGNSAPLYKKVMPEIYASLAQCASVIVTVTKNPTKAKRIVRLDKFTYKFLREAGWRVTDYHRAILWEIQVQGGLWQEKRIPRGRIGFFKRYDLARGLPAANYEDILIGVK